MFKFVALVLVFVTFCHHEVTSVKNEINDRRKHARCLGTVWDWMMGYGKRQYEENIISVNPNNVRFLLFPNPYDPAFFEEIVFEDITSLQKSTYRFGQPFKFLIHGYTMNKDGTFPQNAKNAYLEEYRQRLLRSDTSGFNVIIVDWGPLADPKLSGGASFFFSYAFAVNNVPVVGKRVGEFIQFLRHNGALESYDNVHILGFSLGAHVSGNAGNTVVNMTGQKVARITGLDPAGPNFYLGLNLGGLSSRKLSKEDAKFVDVYHSNQGALGTMDVIGHCDFYPNGGGPVQEDCSKQYENVADTEQKLMKVGSCSHNKGPVYYSRSISTFIKPLLACGCNSYTEFKSDCDCRQKAIFGEHCDPSTRGTFYIDINN